MRLGKDEMSPRSMVTTGAVLVLLALLVRLGFFLVVAHPEARQGAFHLLDETDEIDYHRLASTLVETGKYRLFAEGPPTAKRPPGMILPLAALYALFAPSPWLAWLWVLLCALLLVPLLGRMTHQVGGSPRAVVLAMAITALLPTLVFTAGGIWSEPPSLLFTLLALHLLLRAEQRPTGNSRLWAGLSLAMAFLNRPSVGLVIGLLGLWLLWRAWHSTARKAALRDLVLFTLVTALPILAWGGRNWWTLGEPFLGNTESTAALWGSNNAVTAGLQPPAIDTFNGVDLHQEAASGAYLGTWVPPYYVADDIPTDLDEMALHHWFEAQTRDFIRRHPGAYLKLVGHKLRRTLTAEPMPPSVLGESPTKRRAKHGVALGERWFLLLFGTLGLVQLWRRRRLAAQYYLLFLLGSLPVVIIAYVNARIFLPVSALLIVPTALCLDGLLERARHRFIQQGTQAHTTTTETTL